LLHYLAEKHDVVLFLQGNAATELRCGGKFQSALRRRLFLSTMPKRHQNRTAITKVVAINFRGAVFCNSQRTLVWKTEVAKTIVNANNMRLVITEQENKTSAIKNNATDN